jgi:hypothetical protein
MTPKTYQKIPWDYPFKLSFLVTVLIAFNLTVLYFFSWGNFFQWSLEQSFLFLMYFFGFSDCFETDLFVSVVSKRVWNTETNRNKLLLVSWNKPKMNRNRLSFGLFRFEPKKKFVCFEDTLTARLWSKDTTSAIGEVDFGIFLDFQFPTVCSWGKQF